MDAIEALYRATWERVRARSARPGATYRLQFHAGFTFRQAAAISDYLAALGVTHVYASPYLKARAGSTHGYDVIDHNALNPELGTADDFEAWLASLRAHGLSHILDTVPNHVGVATNHNAWWNDVLTHGPASPYGTYFDIAWRGSPRPEMHDRLLLPVLGKPYGQALEEGELRLGIERHNGAARLVLDYFERRLPVDPARTAAVLEEAVRVMGEDGAAGGDGGRSELESIMTASRHLPGRSDRDPARQAERRRESEVIGRRLEALLAGSEPARRAVDTAVERFNGRAGDPRSMDRLDALLGDQCYRLAYWHVASDEINYRRFFDINDLAALSVERPEVFDATHRLTLDLLAAGKVAGLRVDHPDGLFDPAQYFARLQEAYFLREARAAFAGDGPWQALAWEVAEGEMRQRLAAALPALGTAGELPLYVVVEKILAADEPLIPTWRVDGTSGYDALNVINGLFAETAAGEPLQKSYESFIGREAGYDDLVYANKRLVLETALASELQMLAHRADRLAQQDRRARDLTLRGLRDGLRELIACFPVYRSYVADDGPSETDRRHVDGAVAAAQERNPKMDGAVFAFLRSLILQEPADAADARVNDRRRFAGKFQQLTAPVTAKGIEDTTFYQYHRLASLNEVGGDPGLFGLPPARVHEYFAERQRRWPNGLTPLSTHDTKRSEDVRARLHVLSEVPDEWAAQVTRWRDLAAPARPTVRGKPAPDANDEYLLYQTLLGAWPWQETDEAFVGRIQAYMTKALREAKTHTSWTDANSEYEGAVSAFVAALVRGEEGRAFRDAFQPFQKRVAQAGAVNALAQTLVRLTAPGVPDTYQGTEVWDLSLVDPDNRRPVDYDLRRRLLAEVQGRGTDAGALLSRPEDGRAKLWLTWRGLQLRREHSALFGRGEYLPLAVSGRRRANVFAFARRLAGRAAVVIVPRLAARLTAGGGWPVGDVWADTAVELPETAAWREALTAVPVAGDGQVLVKDALRAFPGALLLGEQTP
jgi:(1->4)-alpha-D-glucan 1-alpha-D-glucosylmutase